MKHYIKWDYDKENRNWHCQYTELTDSQWFDAEKRVDGTVSYALGEEPRLLRVEVKYHSKDYGRLQFNGNKYWECAGMYIIEKADKSELHRLLKGWFPRCEFRYKYA